MGSSDHRAWFEGPSVAWIHSSRPMRHSESCRSSGYLAKVGYGLFPSGVLKRHGWCSWGSPIVSSLRLDCRNSNRARRRSNCNGACVSIIRLFCVPIFFSITDWSREGDRLGTFMTRTVSTLYSCWMRSSLIDHLCLISSCKWVGDPLFLEHCLLWGGNSH